MAKASSVKKAAVAAGNRKVSKNAAPAKSQKPGPAAKTSKASASVAPAGRTTGKKSAPVKTTETKKTETAKKKTATPATTTKKAAGATTTKTSATPVAKKKTGTPITGAKKQTESKASKQPSAAPASKTGTAKQAAKPAAKKTTGTTAKKTSATKQLPVPDILSSSTSRQGTGIMAKEKPTKGSVKTEKATKATKTTTDKKSTAKTAPAATASDTAPTAKTATKKADDTAVETQKKTTATAAAAVVEPVETADAAPQEPVTDLIDDMTTVSTTGEVATDPAADTLADQSSAGEEAARRRQRPKVQYSEAELEEFRVTIEKTREEAVEEFQILRQNLEDITNSELADENASYSMHMAEQGTEAQEKEKIYAQVQRLNDYIKKLDEALQRIKDKTYGICRVCGILIAKERLLAVPITTLSASYKIQKKCPEDGVDRIIAPK